MARTWFLIFAAVLLASGYQFFPDAANRWTALQWGLFIAGYVIAAVVVYVFWFAKEYE
jgi:hypothetical protein